ncbi:hypothetical protein K9L63_01865 [Candidatus Gracilibacteria bacterium]|nr:hypothetical protein [Candidatus Gracilibacteria bacterium]
MIDILIWVGIAIISTGIIVLCTRCKKKLSFSIFEDAKQKISNTEKLAPSHAILEAHKIFISALQTLNSKSKTTAAQATQNVVKRFPNEQYIWQFHRLRNQIAHEPDIHVSPMQAEEARREFVRALESLL